MQVVYAIALLYISLSFLYIKHTLLGGPASSEHGTPNKHTNRERKMNTITITSAPEGATITYTEAEVTRFIEQAGELNDTNKRYTDALREMRSIRNDVRDFFSEGEWDGKETTVNKDEVNQLLERIGASKLTSSYRGNFTITGSFTIDVEDEDDIESILHDNINVECYATDDISVDLIEITDIEDDE